MNQAQMQAWAATRILWVKMCKADNICPTSKFVVFTPSNPHQKEYNEAMARYQALMVKGPVS